MKYILIAFLLTSFTIAANAQLGFTGGINFTNYIYKVKSVKQSRNSIIAYNVGLVYRTKGKKFCLQPEVDYSVKGTRNYDTPFTSGLDYYLNKLNYLQFTLPVVRKWVLVKGISVDLGLGPFGGYLLNATSKAHSFAGGNKTTNFKIGNDSASAFRRMDGGITFLFGCKMQHVGFYLLYDLGLANVDPAKNAVIKTRRYSGPAHHISVVVAGLYGEGHRLCLRSQLSASG